MGMEQLQEAFRNLEHLSYSVRALLAVGSGAIGAVMLLFGYRLFKLYLFLAGLFFGTLIVSFFINPVVSLIIGLIVGLLNLVLWYVGLFLLGVISGMAIMHLLGIHLLPVQLAVGSVVGVFALIFRRLITTILTSVSGAGAVVGMFVFFIPMADVATWALIVGLAVVGIILQYTVLAARSVSAASQPAAQSSAATTT